MKLASGSVQVLGQLLVCPEGSWHGLPWSCWCDCVWLSSTLAQQVASILDPPTSGALGMEPDTQSYHPELRSPVFWKSEVWKEEWGL